MELFFFRPKNSQPDDLQGREAVMAVLAQREMCAEMVFDERENLARQGRGQGP